MEPQGGSDVSRSTARLLSVLAALSEAADGGLRLVDVMRSSKINKTTAHRLLNGLKASGLVDQDDQTGRYFVGMRFLSFAQAARRRFRLTPLLEPVVTRLSQQTQDTVTLIVRSGDELMCVDCREGTFPIKVITLHAGDRRPLGIGAGGIALLAFLPDAEVDRILVQHAEARSAFALDDIRIRQLIAEARKQGYAFNDVHVQKDMAPVADMCAISAPIRTNDHTPVAALHLTAISSRLTQPRRDNIVAALRREVTAIETRFAPILAEMQPSKIAYAGPAPGLVDIEAKRGSALSWRGTN